MKQRGKTGPRIVSIVCESEGVNVKITLKKHIQQIFMQKRKKQKNVWLTARKQIITKPSIKIIIS